ncbi:radical SAM protein [bacterium]|nr:radical SAM protein [bacterium]
MQNSIFGPVPSRRLGRSLGVDLVPYKTCTFDCVYCELGPTTCHTLKRQPYKPIDSVCDELVKRLDQLNGDVDYITLAGSGEPTLNSDLGRLIERIKRISNTPLAILTNGSLLFDPSVRSELRALDLIVPSLDAVSRETFLKVNRPVAGIEIEDIIEGLIKLREEFSGAIWLEVLVCMGINDSESELTLIKNAVYEIKPDKVQVNTVFRPPSIEGTKPVSEKRLKEIEAFIGPIAMAVGMADIKKNSRAGSRSVRTRTLMLLRRRPCTIKDISDALCMARIEAIKLLDLLVDQGEVSRVYHEGEFYYKADTSEREGEK